MHGVRAQPGAGGCLVASACGTDYVVSLASRGPDVGDLRRAHVASGARQRPVVLGPHEYLPRDQRINLRWAADKVDVNVFSELETVDKTRSMAQGNWPL